MRGRQADGLEKVLWLPGGSFLHMDEKYGVQTSRTSSPAPTSLEHLPAQDREPTAQGLVLPPAQARAMRRLFGGQRWGKDGQGRKLHGACSPRPPQRP